MSVSQPPMTGPSVGARPAVALTKDAAMALCLPLNRMTAAVNAVGISEPPHRPWRARNTIIERISHAVLQSTLARVKPAAEAATSQRVDMTWLSHADSGMTTISAIKYDDWIQPSSSWLADRPPPIS
jgi:hypothetical protein